MDSLENQLLNELSGGDLGATASVPRVARQLATTAAKKPAVALAVMNGNVRDSNVYHATAVVGGGNI